MKDLILDPPILLGTLVLGIVYFLVLFNFTKNRRFAFFLERIAECVFFVIISGANFFPFDRLDPSDIGDPEKGLFSALLLLITYALFFILFRGSRKQLFNNFSYLFKQPILGIYIGIICFSVFWSANQEATLRAIAGLLFFSIFAVHFARKYNWQELSRLLRWNSTFIAIYSVFTALFVPSIGICSKGWCGGFGHPISLGNMMALGTTLWLLNVFANPKYYLRSLVCFSICLMVLHFTNSAGALLVLTTLIVLLFFTTFLKKLKFTQAFIFFILLLFVFGISSIWLMENLDNLLFFFNKDVTISGRIPLWTLLLQTSIRERLWFGYGFHAYWQRWMGSESPANYVVNTIVGNGRDWVAHAHNGFLDIILNIGMIGLVIFVCLFLINVVRTIKLVISTKRSESLLPLIILTFTFITNLFISPIVIPSFTWFLFILVTIRLNRFSSQKYEGKYLAVESKSEMRITAQHPL